MRIVQASRCVLSISYKPYERIRIKRFVEKAGTSKTAMKLQVVVTK